MWDLKIIDTDQSLYVAIADAMERDIQLGILKGGERMPTHRELARIVGVNVTTITRAYKEAEKRGLITSTVGRGTFVTSDLGKSASLYRDETQEGRLIELGLVLPLHTVEPDIGDVIGRILKKGRLNQYMGYTPPNGLARHREVGSAWIRRFGVGADAETTVVTAGVQHALICVFSALFQPGDRVAVDHLTYPGVKAAAKRCGIHLEGVPVDLEGILPKELESLCKRTDIKGVYTVSTMENPTNSAMSEQRMNAIAAIIEKRDLLLIEDDIYRFMSASGPAPLSTLIPERSVYLAGVSKAFYAGLRVGFLRAPKRLCGRIAQAVVDTMWMAPSLNAEIVCTCIEEGIADEIIARKIGEIRERAAIAESVLDGYEYRYEKDSMFLWLRLPDEQAAAEFEKSAAGFGVNIVSSEKFAVGGSVPPNYIRISLSGAENRKELHKGLTVIQRLLDGEIGSPEGIL